MENTSKNIQIVALFFFFTIGIGYLLSSLLAMNQHLLPISETIKKALFLPLILMAIAYATSSLIQGLASEEKSSRIQTMVISGVGLIAAAIAIGIYFALPNISS